MRKPYYQQDGITIYLGDCGTMEEVKSQSIDLVITSPPFNLGNVHHTGSSRQKPYFDEMPEPEYRNWQLQVLNILYNKVTKEGSCWYHHKNRIKSGLQISPYLWILKSKWLIKQEIVWFNGSQNFDKIRFYPMTERLYWLAKDPKVKLFNAVNKHDLWRIKAVGTRGQFTRAYPEELVNRILACFTPAQLLLDPFLGSGTTAVCAKKLGKQCIGYELKEEFCELAVTRLEAIV